MLAYVSVINIGPHVLPRPGGCTPGTALATKVAAIATADEMMPSIVKVASCDAGWDQVKSIRLGD